jgi:hypothetical protein
MKTQYQIRKAKIIEQAQMKFAHDSIKRIFTEAYTHQMKENPKSLSPVCIKIPHEYAEILFMKKIRRGERVQIYGGEAITY